MESQPQPPTEYDRIVTIQLFEDEARQVIEAINNTLGELCEVCEVREMHLLQSARNKIISRM